MKNAAKESEIVLSQTQELSTPVTEDNPAAMIQYAISQGATPEMLRELLMLKREYEQDEAEKAFNIAMAAFKADPPVVVKNNHVCFKTSKGVTEYSHATLDHVAQVISEKMTPHGLSFTWNTDTKDGKVTVECVVRHAKGHCEKTSMTAGADTSGSKNPIQAMGSTVTYLQRYTLLAATGIAAGIQDNDGYIEPAEPEYIDETQLAALRSKLKDTETNEQIFCKVCKIDSLEHLPESKFQQAMSKLEEKAGK